LRGIKAFDKQARLLTVSNIETKMIPSIETCLHLMNEYEMLGNIKDHSVVVARVAHLIARGLCDAGLNISVEKTTAGALIHDIGKTCSLYSGEDHSEIGEQICVKNNLHEIADIVAEHVRLRNYDLNGNCSEREIVYYADKRVNDDRIVDLEERLAYIIERYGRNHKELCRAIKKNFELCKKIEGKLFRKLDFTPNSLEHLAKDEKIGKLDNPQLVADPDESAQ
jgi:putative nucleotidyltransferase with HDIG domain